jgi:hypothetical protein
MRYDPVVLVQGKYRDSGLYNFKCSLCEAEIAVLYSFWFNTTDRKGPIPVQCPLKYCWNCGTEFDSFEIGGDK